MQNKCIYTVIESALLIDKSSDMENESKVKMIKSAPPLLISDLPVNISQKKDQKYDPDIVADNYELNIVPSFYIQ